MKFYYFTSTHWDREWYQPFQAYRKYLVDTCEQILELLEQDEAYRQFTFDGQTIVLEDILQIRPELEPRLRKLIAAGRLHVGPWYVMPDEFLCSGEALIRNLLTGKSIAEKFGGTPWPVGYVCDIFGHIARLPQLLAGFGMEGIVLWRGVPEDLPACSFWRAPDGSTLPVIRLHPVTGYSQFSLTIRGWVYELPMDRAEFLERFAGCVDRERTFWGDDFFLLTDSFDHCMPGRDAGRYLNWIREAYPDAEIVWSDYRDLFRDAFADRGRIPTITGEMIAPSTAADKAIFQLSDTLSARYDVKQANDRCQTMLEGLVEPELAFRLRHGDRRDLPFLKYAWKHLLQNHAHDSICGCSIDAVHELMAGRFTEVLELCDTLNHEFLNTDRSACLEGSFWQQVMLVNDRSMAEAEAAPDGRYVLRIFNPAPKAMEKVLDLELDFPAAVPYPETQAEPFGYEHYNRFLLRDAAGRELPYGIRRVRRNTTALFHRQDCRRYDRYAITVKVLLEPAGWTTLTLEPSARPVRFRSRLLTGRRSAANGKVALDIHSDGTWTLTDLRRNRSFPGQNEYYFEREIGDGWNHVAPLDAARCVSTGTAQVALVYQAPDKVEFEIVRRYELPSEVRYTASIHECYTGIRESAERTELVIRTTLALDSVAEQVEVHTHIENRLSDVRVQLGVPTGINGGAFASQAFGFVPRPDGRTDGAESNLELERIEKNFDAVLGKRDDRGGLALLSAGGLHAGGAMGSDAPGELVVTLFRSFRRTATTDGESGGQLHRELTFHYALAPFGPETDENALYQAATALRLATPSYLLRGDLARCRDSRTLLRVDSPAVVTALKPAEDGGGVVLRLVNMSSAAVPVKITGGFDRARYCRLDEQDAGALAPAAPGVWECRLAGGEMRSLQLFPPPPGD